MLFLNTTAGLAIISDAQAMASELGGATAALASALVIVMAVANTLGRLFGHFIGIAVGLPALAVFGLLGDVPSVPQAGATPSYVLAGTLSVALTGLLQIFTRTWHPPAGATTLIVNLGVLGTLREAAVLALGIVVLTVAGWLIDRASGVRVPVWSSKEGVG